MFDYVNYQKSLGKTDLPYFQILAMNLIEIYLSERKLQIIRRINELLLYVQTVFEVMVPIKR